MFETIKETLRKERNDKIKADYEELRTSYPDVSKNRIYHDIAVKYNISANMVRLIILNKQTKP